MLEDALRRIGGWQTLPEIRTVPSRPYEYRNRMRFHRAGPEQGAGLMGRRSGTAIPLQDCPAADPLIRRALQEGRIKAPPGRECFTLYGRRAALYCEGRGGGFPSGGPVSVRDRELVMDCGVFFQSNGALLEILIADLIEASAEADHSRPMADLYCGAGTFAAFLADRFPWIDLAEASPAAVELARRNITRENARFFAQSDEAWARRMLRRGRGGEQGACPYGMIIADPPRGGLSRTLRRWLAHSGPALLCYVSCDPASLARDSKELREGGCGLRSLTFYDFYPQTAHIESLAIFTRSRP
jgi:23S rRNA (uracil1939-C5)-methyltransferase